MKLAINLSKKKSNSITAAKKLLLRGKDKQKFLLQDIKGLKSQNNFEKTSK